MLSKPVWPAARQISRRRLFSTQNRRQNHYQTLGIPQDASKAQIKTSFYRLSKQHHPDLSQDPKSPETFTKLSEAYQVLSNDRERRAYDRSLLHRGAGEAQSARYSPHAPPPRSPRATHAWKYSYTVRTARGTFTGTASSSFSGTQKTPPPDYSFTTPRSQGPHPYHDVLKGKRKKKEEEDREMDKMHNSSTALRALNLSIWLSLPILLAGVLRLGAH